MFRSGRFVADYIDPISEQQVQPNGVDLTFDRITVPVESGAIHRAEASIGERKQIEAETGADGRQIYHLDPGAYIVRYGEVVHIPSNHIGFIYPRSSLMRNGGMVNTAVWDAGYEGRGEGLLQLHHPIALEAGARIAQIVFAEADHEESYTGAYQREHLE